MWGHVGEWQVGRSNFIETLVTLVHIYRLKIPDMRTIQWVSRGDPWIVSFGSPFNDTDRIALGSLQRALTPPQVRPLTGQTSTCARRIRRASEPMGQLLGGLWSTGFLGWSSNYCSCRSLTPGACDVYPACERVCESSDLRPRRNLALGST